MKSYQTRQGNLRKYWNFDCSCELCQEEKVENCDEIYAKFEQLNQEADRIQVDNGRYMTFPESYLRLSNLYKEMYKMAKVKKVSRTFIVWKILQKGFQAAISGYLHAKDRMGEGQKCLQEVGQSSRHERDSGVKQTAKQNKEVFKKECELFANAGVLIGEIVLPDKELQDWKMKKDNLDFWIEQKIANKFRKCNRTSQIPGCMYKKKNK